MPRKMKKIKLKFNGGYCAILCSKCNKIIKIGSQFDDIENAYIKCHDESEDCAKLCKILHDRLVQGYYLCDDCKNDN